jgi:hypothetical protein
MSHPCLHACVFDFEGDALASFFFLHWYFLQYLCFLLNVIYLVPNMTSYLEMEILQDVKYSMGFWSKGALR